MAAIKSNLEAIEPWTSSNNKFNDEIWARRYRSDLTPTL